VAFDLALDQEISRGIADACGRRSENDHRSQNCASKITPALYAG